MKLHEAQVELDLILSSLYCLETGVVKVWWDLFLDKFGQHTISSHPGRPENHWPQVATVFRVWRGVEFGNLPG